MKAKNQNLGRLNKYIIPLVIMLGSMAIRALYVSYISIYRNQHDGGVPYTLGGHVGYITWYLNEFKLPDFDVRTADQFWHPPLHYVLCASLLKIVWRIFPSTNGNIEIAQLLPFLYVTITIFLVLCILRHFFGEKDLFLQNVVLLFVAFQPGLVIRSAMLNNDALVMMLVILCFYLLLKWHDNPSWKTMIAIAVVFGLALMSKKSAAVVALPIAVLFVHRFVSEIILLAGKRNARAEVYKEKNKVMSILLQFCVFLIIAAPLGLWWYIRNYVAYGVPFDFFWNIDEGWAYDAYLGKYSVTQRLFDFNPRYFSYVNTYVQHFTDRLQDINPLVALLKSAVSDVWTWSYGNDIIRKLSYIMLLSRTLLIALCVISIPVFIIRKNGENKGSNELLQKLAVVLFFIAQLIFYYSFCFEYPYVWTMDYRYVEVIVFCDALFLCTWLNICRKNKVLQWASSLLVLVFAVASSLFFVVAKSLFSGFLY